MLPFMDDGRYSLNVLNNHKVRQRVRFAFFYECVPGFDPEEVQKRNPHLPPLY